MKKFNKKLVLNKLTIANLNLEEMNELRGGLAKSRFFCFTILKKCTNGGCTKSCDAPICIPLFRKKKEEDKRRAKK